MQKVLILTNSINGLYNFRRELVEELLQKDIYVVISAPLDTKTEYFKGIGCKMVETVINSRGTNPFLDIKLLSHYNKLFKDTAPDIVLTYTIKPNVYGGLMCRLRGIPQIANITGLGSAVENKGPLQKITIRLYQLGLKKAKCIFFQNKENMEFMQSHGVGRYNGRLIPGSGVNLKHYQMLEYINSKKINFLFISRVMKEKGINQYLEAASFIKKKYPHTIFHIIGNCEESYYEKLDDFERKGIIKYHGRQSDVREFHKISQCTIHPTYYPEGMSNVLLESAACGRPIITTNRSGCREIVDEGINGFIVEQQNSQDLINKIEKFLALNFNERKEMGIAGRRKVEKDFDRQVVVQAYVEEIFK